MGININCIYNYNKMWCRNKNIEKGLFGLGAKHCIEYPYGNGCIFKEEYKKPKPPPPPPPKRT